MASSISCDKKASATKRPTEYVLLFHKIRPKRDNRTL